MPNLELGLRLLIVVGVAYGYTTVSIERLCHRHESVRLEGSNSATSIVLEGFNTSKPCRVEVTAPATHHVSFLFTQRRRAVERALMHNLTPSPCLLTVAYPMPRVEEDIKMTVDLCSVAALDTMKYTELLPPLLTLDWVPSNAKTEDILALELVFAAVGRGREVCSQPDQFPCMVRPHYPMYCVASELVCDGRPNCPYSGTDEDKELCNNAGGTYEKLAPARFDENWHLGQGLEFLASEMFKKFIINKNTHPKKHESNSSLEKSTVQWQDEDSKDPTNRVDNFPNLLNQYGPWGYLMLGMLICGTVLMFCGLWECCCRRPKTPSNVTGPALLIINQGTQAEIDVPVSQNPPRYEDLDQPPSYAALFPGGNKDLFLGDGGVLPIDSGVSISTVANEEILSRRTTANFSDSVQVPTSSQDGRLPRGEIYTIPTSIERNT